MKKQLLGLFIVGAILSFHAVAQQGPVSKKIYIMSSDGRKMAFDRNEFFALSNVIKQLGMYKKGDAPLELKIGRHDLTLLARLYPQIKTGNPESALSTGQKIKLINSISDVDKAGLWLIADYLNIAELDNIILTILCSSIINHAVVPQLFNRLTFQWRIERELSPEEYMGSGGIERKAPSVPELRGETTLHVTPHLIMGVSKTDNTVQLTMNGKRILAIGLDGLINKNVQERRPQSKFLDVRFDPAEQRLFVVKENRNPTQDDDVTYSIFRIKLENFINLANWLVAGCAKVHALVYLELLNSLEEALKTKSLDTLEQNIPEAELIIFKKLHPLVREQILKNDQSEA